MFHKQLLNLPRVVLILMLTLVYQKIYQVISAGTVCDLLTTTLDGLSLEWLE